MVVNRCDRPSYWQAQRLQGGAEGHTRASRLLRAQVLPLYLPQVHLYICHRCVLVMRPSMVGASFSSLVEEVDCFTIIVAFEELE